MTALEEYEDGLHGRMRAGLEAIPGVHCHNHAPLRTPTELFSVDGVPGAEVYSRLAEVKVNAPAGSFYAIEAAEWMGLGASGAVRAGLAPYTSADDVDRLLAGVAQIAAG
jgi:selenocysteine lyase/cysteine desulfurase